VEKVVTKRNLKDSQNDYAYWMTKSPAERISALELLRQHYLSLTKDAPQRLQRVYRIVDKPSG